MKCKSVHNQFVRSYQIIFKFNQKHTWSLACALFWFQTNLVLNNTAVKKCLHLKGRTQRKQNISETFWKCLSEGLSTFEKMKEINATPFMLWYEWYNWFCFIFFRSMKIHTYVFLATFCSATEFSHRSINTKLVPEFHLKYLKDLSLPDFVQL